MPTELRQCVYCLRLLPLSAFSGVDHVIPRTLGTFENNFTLDCVCAECNHGLGSGVEWILAQGSLEAVLAIQYGIRPAAEAARLLRDRVSLEYPEGEYSGLQLGFIDRDGELVIGPVAQVGLARRTGCGFRFFTERELARLRAIPGDVDPNGEKRIIAMSERDAQRLIALLGHRGISYRHIGSLSAPPGWGQVQASLDFTVDVMVRRCVAKIAFNYLAYVMAHATAPPDPEFVYRRDFDTIRFLAVLSSTEALQDFKKGAPSPAQAACSS
jgi:hypothetical protein